MFDDAGKTYNVTKILTHDDKFDHAKYSAYSQVSTLDATCIENPLRVFSYIYPSRMLCLTLACNLRLSWLWSFGSSWKNTPRFAGLLLHSNPGLGLHVKSQRKAHTKMCPYGGTLWQESHLCFVWYWPVNIGQYNCLGMAFFLPWQSPRFSSFQ